MPLIETIGKADGDGPKPGDRPFEAAGASAPIIDPNWGGGPRKDKNMRLITSLAAFLATTGAALAHTGHGAHTDGGFTHGFMHPIGGADHLLAMVGVGLLAYLVSERSGSAKALWLVPAAFITAMAAGGVLGLTGTAFPLMELAIGLSVIVIGGAAALGSSLPVAAAMTLVGFFAIFHGQAHGLEMPLGSSAAGYGAGFLIATGLLHGAGIALGLRLSRVAGSHAILAARASGGAMALAGAGVLAGVL
jgi:urease accessory protein